MHVLAQVGRLLLREVVGVFVDGGGSGHRRFRFWIAAGEGDSGECGGANDSRQRHTGKIRRDEPEATSLKPKFTNKPQGSISNSRLAGKGLEDWSLMLICEFRL